MISKHDSLAESTVLASTLPLDANEQGAVALLDQSGISAPVEESPPGLTHLCLMLAQTCNLRCPYCYAGAGQYGNPRLMSREVAFAAIDMLFDRGGAGNYRFTLFGGEPLLNFGVLVAAVEYAEARAAGAGRVVTFELNTNGTLITAEIVDFLRGRGLDTVVSLDGDRAVHDRTRSSANGGTYDVILDRVSPWLQAGDPRLSAVATVTHLDPDVERHVTHLLGLGFAQVSARPVATTDPAFALTRDDWQMLKAGTSALASRFLAAAERGELFGWQQMIARVRQIWRGTTRGWRCGAGSRGLAVDVEGRLYPCHRFVGHEQFVWGDVWRGPQETAEQAFRKTAWVDRRPGCADCWARYLCGGRCYQREALAVDGPEQREGRCALMRHEIALALQVHERMRKCFGDHWLARLMLSEELARRGWLR